MGYRKHFAYYHAGDFQESFLCVCERVSNHMVSRPGSQPAQPPLFELDIAGNFLVASSQGSPHATRES